MTQVISIHKERWEDLSAVEFEWLAIKSQYLFTSHPTQLIVSSSLFNSMGRKLKTGQLVDHDEILQFENGLTVIPDGMFYGK